MFIRILRHPIFYCIRQHKKRRYFLDIIKRDAGQNIISHSIHHYLNVLPISLSDAEFNLLNF